MMDTVYNHNEGLKVLDLVFLGSLCVWENVLAYFEVVYVYTISIDYIHTACACVCVSESPRVHVLYEIQKMFQPFPESMISK